LERAVTQALDGFRHETRVAIAGVERALELARRGVGAAATITKGGRDLVTATDVAAEDAVRGIVRDAVGAVVVGEERGGEAPADDSPYWLSIPSAGPATSLPEFPCTA
jgi:fructose-1,6-bisphosphatase/inositol monophosphatase family enzyme